MRTIAVVSLVALLALWVGLECGYRIGHNVGFQACQEQF